MLDQISVIVLTLNEAPNIERTLGKLGWAKRVVLVDSFSGDDTLARAGRFPQVKVFQRRFDTHAHQWNFALRETGIDSEWVLALDADYVLTDGFIRELETLNPPSRVSGYEARFRYCVFGKPLRSSIYPPVTVLFRRAQARYVQEGHTQRVVSVGEKHRLDSVILHDDRKSFGRWFESQKSYQRLECDSILRTKFKELNFADRVRKLRFMAPFAVFFYCVAVKGLLWDGWRGVYYSFQRALAEAILSWYLVSRDLRKLFGGYE
ncbi:MAG: glycosyltransferase family 2 protein [Candidatus Omnitrophica bacterium]|nr:glycosyltransferase family 2 protein [Candidatus Omnitrophota bacterium]